MRATMSIGFRARVWVSVEVPDELGEDSRIARDLALDVVHGLTVGEMTRVDYDEDPHIDWLEVTE